MEEYYIKKSDVERIIEKRLNMVERNVAPGKGLKNSIINLKAVKEEVDDLYCVKVKFEEPTIFKIGGK